MNLPIVTTHLRGFKDSPVSGRCNTVFVVIFDSIRDVKRSRVFFVSGFFYNPYIWNVIRHSADGFQHHGPAYRKIDLVYLEKEAEEENENINKKKSCSQKTKNNNMKNKRKENKGKEKEEEKKK